MGHYDIIVAGAGPAGSEFAYRMAKAGFKVLVLEKDKLKREKPCGGGIPVQEIIEFGKLPSCAVERRIRNARIISPDNNVLEMWSTDEGAVVKRSVYDSFLQERAKKAGAVFVEKCSVTRIKKLKGKQKDYVEIRTGKKKYPAKLLADASGYPCSIKGVPGRSRKSDDKDIVATYHMWMRLPEATISRKIGNCIEMYCGKNVVPNGYAWIFPKKDVVSAGIGTTKDTVKKQKISLKKLLNNFIKKHPIASKKLKGGRIVKTGGGLIPIAVLPKLHSGNIIFIGDAGGFANPLHAGGIYQARKSAVIAAKHCRRFLKAKTDKERTKTLESYDKEARELFYEKGSKWDLKMRNFFWNDELLNKVVRKAKKEKKVKEAVGVLLSMTKPHEKSYNVLESEMLDIIHSAATEKVEQYKKLVSKELRLFNKNENLDRYAKHSFFGDAKRLRVSLILLSCDLFKGDLKKASRLAPVYELLHTASLVHDDIMDKAKTRRGRKTLHSICGVNNAIVTGDFLIGKTYGVLSKGLAGLPERQKADVLAIIGKSTIKCCYGQTMDLELAAKKRYSSINDYLRMVGLKTGSMIEGAMKKGAVIANASAEDIDIIGRIGANIGTAFQVIDDSIDLLGNNKSKSLQNDLRQGKATPMLIYALKNADKKQKRFLMNVIGSETGKKEMDKVIDIYRKTEAIEYSQKLSGVYVEKARKEIERLKSSKRTNKKALAVLEEVVDVMGYWALLAD